MKQSLAVQTGLLYFSLLWLSHCDHALEGRRGGLGMVEVASIVCVATIIRHREGCWPDLTATVT